MRKTMHVLMLLLLGMSGVSWCGESGPTDEEPIPPLRGVFRALPDAVRQEFMRRKRELNQEYEIFKAEGDAFTAKPAEEQTDAEFAALQDRRTKYIEKAKCFNQDVDEARLPLVWEVNHPERQAWSQGLRQAIAASIRDLEKASDEQKHKFFGPQYERLSPAQRLDVWACLFVAMAKYEAPGFKPEAVFREKSGVLSIGLLMVSYENQWFYGYSSELSAVDIDESLPQEARQEARKKAQQEVLKNPRVNLRCGVKVLAKLVAADRVIASGKGDPARGGTSMGGAQYWSVLREGNRQGKQETLLEIQKMTQQQARTE